jgi:hypothetical protein
MDFNNLGPLKMEFLMDFNKGPILMDFSNILEKLEKLEKNPPIREIIGEISLLNF